MTHTVLRGVDILLVVCVALQLVPVTRGNPPIVSDIPTTLEVKVVLQRACYDCHPWSTRRGKDSTMATDTMLAVVKTHPERRGHHPCGRPPLPPA